MRTSPVHYIAPSAISITPNCNESANDLAVYIARNTKIKVYSPEVDRLGMNTDTNTYREWNLSGRNRSLRGGDGPYTIYARLKKSDVYETSDAYLVFAKRFQYPNDNPYGLAGKWFDKYSYVTREGLSEQYDDRGFPRVVDDPDYWWVKLGEVSEVNNGLRTVDLDTGILGTDEYNSKWELDPDELPLRVDLDCTVSGRTAGAMPCVYWGDTLNIMAHLVEGWAKDLCDKVTLWTIRRDTGDTDNDALWNADNDGKGRTMTVTEGVDGGIYTMKHLVDEDDFEGIATTQFVITAWGEEEQEEEQETVSGGSTAASLVKLAATALTVQTETKGIYEVDLSGYIDVATVDDAGNLIGGLYTTSQGNDDYRTYRIHSAITVRKEGEPLLFEKTQTDGDDNPLPASKGHYTINGLPHDCEFLIENSTIYITKIANIKDGEAGSDDDNWTPEQYEAMRQMESCSVDLVIDCEGVVQVIKNFPVTIKHDSQPYIGAVLTNMSSGISWNTRTARYIGLPVTFDVVTWRNDEYLSVTDCSLTNPDDILQVVRDEFKNTTATPDASKLQCTIEKVSQTRPGKTYYVARITFIAAPQNLPAIVPINVTAKTAYSGVNYERQLTHTLNKTTDTNIYQVKPSVRSVPVGYDSNGNRTPSVQNVTCRVTCDSSDDEHYDVAISNGKNTQHRLVLTSRKDTIGEGGATVTGTETLYNGAVTVDTSTRNVRFTVYSVDDASYATLADLLHPDNHPHEEDSQDVPLVYDGIEGSDGIVADLRNEHATVVWSTRQNGWRNLNAAQTTATVWRANQKLDIDNNGVQLYVNGDTDAHKAVKTPGETTDTFTWQPGVGQTDYGCRMVVTFNRSTGLLKVSETAGDFVIPTMPKTIVLTLELTATNGGTQYTRKLNFFIDVQRDGYSFELVPIVGGSDWNAEAVSEVHGVYGTSGYTYTPAVVSCAVEASDDNGTVRVNPWSDIEEAGVKVRIGYRVTDKNGDTISSNAPDSDGERYELGITITDDVENVTYILYKKNATTGRYDATNETETVPVVRDGVKGNDGAGQPDYIQYQEAWSNDESTTNINTAPNTEHGRTDGTESNPAEADWHDSTPANPNNYAYLWRRSRKMVLKSDGTYEPENQGGVPTAAGTWKYTRLSGTNGTSIKTKGTVAAVITASDTWPTSGFKTGDIGIKQGDGTPYKATVSEGVATWSKSGMSASDDGDSYTMTKDCSIDLDGDGTPNNIKGHLIMWSSEAGKWIDLGQFKGDAGTTYYTHVAWGKDVVLSSSALPIPDGQTNRPNASSVPYFSISPATGYNWMGILINTSVEDPTASDKLKYTWQNTEGPQGPQGGRTATVYLYKRSATAISTVGISQTLHYKFADKKLYTYDAQTQEYSEATSNDLNGWSLTIPEGNDPIYVTAAIAYSETSYDDIGNGEWVTPALFTGEHGINSASVFLYKRAASAPTGAAASPQQTLYYKFADGELYTTSALATKATTQLNGWERAIPASNGNPCYVIQAAALSSEPYDAIEVVPAQSKNDWSSVRKLVEDGAEGNGISSITRTYAISANATSTNDSTPPADLDPYDQTDWSDSSPATTNAKQYLWAREVITYTKQGVSDTVRYYCIGKKGDNGIDAQDVEWVYVRTKTEVPPVIVDDEHYTDSYTKTYTDDDHLPKVRVATTVDIIGNTHYDINGYKTETIEGTQYHVAECTDEPKGINDTWKYEWEIKRTKGAATNGRRTWNSYSGPMTLHNNYAESAFIIDTDNDNDQFGTDSESKVLVAQTRSTTVSLYDGATKQTLKTVGGLSVSLTYEDDTPVPTTGANAVATYTATPSTGVVAVTILENRSTAFSHEAIRALITATDTSNRSKQTVFTIRKVMSGQPGLSPTIFQLNPTNKTFSFSRDTSNNLLPASRTTIVNALKTIGNSTTAASTSTDGVTYSWAFDNDAATQAHTGLALGTQIEVSNTQANAHYQVWVELSTGDRETLPIVKDGTNAPGVNPNILVDTLEYKDLSKWFKLNSTKQGTYQGRIVRMSSNSDSQGELCARMAEQLIADNTVVKLSPDAWYTLSAYFKSDDTPAAQYALSILQGRGNIAAIRREDGTEEAVQPDTENVDVAVSGTASIAWERHWFSFKTKATIDTSTGNKYMYASLRMLIDAEDSTIRHLYMSMPKLEIGDSPTAYIPNEEDQKGEKGDNAAAYTIVFDSYSATYNSDTKKFNGTASCHVVKNEGGNSSVFDAGSMTVKHDRENSAHTMRKDVATYYTQDQSGQEYYNDTTVNTAPSTLEFKFTYNNVVVATAVLPVSISGRSIAGETGKMFYISGIFDRKKTYARTSEVIPVAWFDDGVTRDGNTARGAYFSLSEDSNQYAEDHQNNYAPAETDGNGNTYHYTAGIWTEAQGFGLVITQGIFAEFAKMGAFIMSGDWMFSTNGRVGNVNYNDGDDYISYYDEHGEYTGGVPAYTLFDDRWPLGDGAPVDVGIKNSLIKGVAPGVSEWQQVSENITLRKYNTYMIYVEGYKRNNNDFAHVRFAWGNKADGVSSIYIGAINSEDMNAKTTLSIFVAADKNIEDAVVMAALDKDTGVSRPSDGETLFTSVRIENVAKIPIVNSNINNTAYTDITGLVCLQPGSKYRFTCRFNNVVRDDNEVHDGISLVLKYGNNEHITPTEPEKEWISGDSILPFEYEIPENFGTSMFTIQAKSLNQDYQIMELLIEQEVDGRWHCAPAVFSPNYGVDGRSGMEVGAKGNFLIKPTGDIEMNGTLRVRNLVTNVCLFAEGGIYSTNYWYLLYSPSISYGSAGDTRYIENADIDCGSVYEYNRLKELFERVPQGSYVEWTEEFYARYGEPIRDFKVSDFPLEYKDVFLKTSYDADIIRMVPTDQSWSDHTPLLLPDPKDFQGKLIEVQAFSWRDEAKPCYVKCVVKRGDNGQLATGIYYDGSEFVINSLATEAVTVNTGERRTFHSMRIGNDWYWVADQVETPTVVTTNE